MVMYICTRKKLYWIFLYLIFFGICWVVVQPLICNEKDTTESIIQNCTNKSKTIEENVSSINSKENDYYLAAVVAIGEISPLKNALQTLIDVIAECGKSMVDIVIFPESCLYDSIPLSRSALYIPSASDFIVPCYHKDYQESRLRQLSCAAKENNIYVAINLLEKVRSANSLSWDGILLYNTEVVFDRNGMVIARYRKFNLYTEKWLVHTSTTNEPELVVFKTDFGVEFGLVVCFDIFFNYPGVELVKKFNITHIIHSSQMASRLPFAAASSVEFGWSYALDVVVLSSSRANNKETIGTNIYFGRRLGTKTYVLPFQTSNIIIAPVPKTRQQTTPPYPREYDSLKQYTPSFNAKQVAFLKSHVLDRMITKPLSTANENSTTFTYKSATFECNISASWDYLDYIPNYQFVAYSGLDNFSIASINNQAEVCGIALCSPTTPSFCQQPPRFEDASKFIFRSAHITARSTILDSIRIPIAVDSRLVPLDGSMFIFNSHLEDHFGQMTNYIDMRLEHPVVNLMNFGVLKFAANSTPIANFNLYDYYKNLDNV